MKTRKLLAMLVAVAMIVTMLPVVAFAEGEAEEPTFEFVYDAPKTVAVNTDVKVEVTFNAELNDGNPNDYGNVLFVFDAEGPTGSTVIFKATDSAGKEHKFTNGGSWGPDTGFPLFDNENDKYSAETLWTLNFDTVGKYTITFQLVTVKDNDKVETLASDKVEILVVGSGSPGYSAAASYIVDYDDKADIGTAEKDEGAEIILRFRDTSGAKLEENQPVYIWIESSRDAESIKPGEIGNGQIVQIGKNSEVKFVVKSGVPGKATISFYTGDPDGEGAEKGRLIDEAVIEFVTVKKDINVSLGAEYDDDDKAVAGKRFSLIATVTDSSGWELDDEEVTFYERKGESGSFKSIGKAKTDRNGEAELKISREKAGNYYYYAKVGSVNTKDAPTLVKVEAAAPYSIEADKDVYYVDADKKEATVKFVVKDRYGNNVPNKDILEVVVIDPDGDDEEYDDKDDVFGVDKNNKITFTFDIDDEGEYEVEANIKDTSISAETKVIVGEFGKVKEIKLELRDEEDGKIDPAVIRSSSDGDIEGYRVVAKLIDEDGIEVDADDYGDEVVFSTNKPSLATVARYDGHLVVKEDAAGVVTITAVHLDSGVEASLDISIGGSPVDLLVDVSSEGLAADVTVAYVDEEGIKTYAVEDEEEVTDYQVIVPEGVEVIDQDEFEYGEAEFTLEAEEYGTYSVRVVTEIGISKTFDVTFSEKEEKPAAGKVVLTIGGDIGFVDGAPTELDAPAFIEDGRTFVPVRFLAEAVGAEADWEPKDAAVETVYLTWEDMQIIIKIGEEALTVVKDGEEEVVTFDGAARIVNGRTFLPFRAIGEAIGLEVDYGPKDGPVKWVSYN